MARSYKNKLKVKHKKAHSNRGKAKVAKSIMSRRKGRTK